MRILLCLMLLLSSVSYADCGCVVKKINLQVGHKYHASNRPDICYVEIVLKLSGEVKKAYVGIVHYLDNEIGSFLYRKDGKYDENSSFHDTDLVEDITE